MFPMPLMLAVARAWMMRVHVVIDQQIDYLENCWVNPKGRQTPLVLDSMLMLDVGSWSSITTADVSDDPMRAPEMRSIDVQAILAITEADFSCYFCDEPKDMPFVLDSAALSCV